MKRNKKNKYKESRIADDWFRIGEEELNFAKAAFKDLNAFYPHICFLCQQAAEKYLKGFLVFHRKRFPKIHHLVYLLKLCAKIDKEFLNLIEEANIVSQYYLIIRYPIEYKGANKKEAKEIIEITEKIIKFVKSKIKK